MMSSGLTRNRNFSFVNLFSKKYHRLASTASGRKGAKISKLFKWPLVVKLASKGSACTAQYGKGLLNRVESRFKVAFLMPSHFYKIFSNFMNFNEIKYLICEQIQFYYYETCFRSFFGENRRHQKDLSKLIDLKNL